MKTLKYSIPVLVMLSIIACTWAAVDLHRYAHQPAGQDDTQITFEVLSGEGFNILTSRLRAAGVISSQLRFKILSRINGYDKRLQAGEYRFTAAMTPIQILDALVNGKVFLRRFTIPEGYNLNQIAQEMQRLGFANAKHFLEAVSDPQKVIAMGFEGATLEGYLFPDTYYFPKGVSVEEIIHKMTDRFHEVFNDQWQQRAKELNLSIHEVITLASIIEKETGDPSERPLIASVFYNRLKKRMRLESDPTVIYGIKNFDGNLKRKHLKTRTPYNTYVIRGLPVGPIANPGRSSIEAALFPAQTDYLFFVSKRDTTHHFSTNIKEHNRAVRRFQLRRHK